MLRLGLHRLVVATKGRTNITQMLQPAVASQVAPQPQLLRWSLLKLLHATGTNVLQLHHLRSASANGKRMILLTANLLPTRRSAKSSKSPTAADQHLHTPSHRLRSRVTVLTPHPMLDALMMATTHLKLLITLHHFLL